MFALSCAYNVYANIKYYLVVVRDAAYKVNSDELNKQTKLVYATRKGCTIGSSL